MNKSAQNFPRQKRSQLTRKGNLQTPNPPNVALFEISRGEHCPGVTIRLDVCSGVPIDHALWLTSF